MAREYGKEYPERELMAVISDLLGIPHFSTSSGSTVRKDFLRAVAAALDVPDYEALNKDPLLAAIIEHVTGDEMDDSLFSPGTTITDEALQTIINGIVESGFFVSIHEDDTDRDAGSTLTDEQILDLIDPGRSQPPDIRDQLVQAHRDEQDQFRQLLLRAYEGRCALTDDDVVQTLKAVHVIPPSEGGPDLVTNGILLRVDLALLFSAGLLVIDEQNYTVELQGKATGPYEQLRGRKLRDPVPPDQRPAVAGLEWRRARANK